MKMQFTLSFIRMTLCFAALGLFGGGVHAQGYPNRTVSIVVGWPPGAGVDQEARVIATQLTTMLGQPVVVINKPGAGSNIGMETVAKAAPDGYTILYSSTGFSINSSLYKKVGYTPADFEPVTMTMERQNLLTVHPSLPVKSVQELVAYAKANPGKLNYGSVGNGSTGHLAGELFKMKAGVNMVHIPYKGGGQVLVDLISGKVEVSFNTTGTTLPSVTGGRLRALAVAGSRRSAQLPDIPTVIESGIAGYELSSWTGVFVPKGTPKDIVAKLHGAIVKILQTPEMMAMARATGVEIVGNTPEEFAAQLKAEIPKWAGVIEASGARLD